jgi:hypothetical protein
MYSRLQSLRGLYLGKALRAAIEAQDLDLAQLDHDLGRLVPAVRLKRAASVSLRGEVFFPVPYLIRKAPYLLGYYRLLYGFSQKEFYKREFARVKGMEARGTITDATAPLIEPLCHSLIQTAGILFDEVEPLALDIVNDLQLLTLGPQLRGGHNVDVGQVAVKSIAELLKKLLATYDVKDKGRKLTIENDSGLLVEISYGSDPDISVVQKLGSGEERKLVAIEIKGGTDASNVWNRLGEAEKSHRSAKKRGYNEMWTVTAVDLEKSPDVSARAREKTPTTTRFFFLGRIVDTGSAEGISFRDLLGSVMGAKLA